jgi:arginine deiminase
MNRVHVTSEVGALRSVLIHSPGRELQAVTPDTRTQYLYDDIIDVQFARREHTRLQQVLRRFSEVHEVKDLLRDVLERPDAREFLSTRTQDRLHSNQVERMLADMSSEELATLLIEGGEEEGGPIARCLNAGGYTFPPAPNLFFTRDIGVVIGEQVVIGSMRHSARWSEEMLTKALFRFHPALEHAGFLYDGSAERRLNYTLEGGDVHPLRSDLLLVGYSSRSSAPALDHLCDLVFERTAITDVIVVVLPGEPIAIHLDMIFTQVDRDVAVAYPPHFFGPGRLAVLHRRRGADTVHEAENLFSVLRSVDYPLEPVLCGGQHRTIQDREQWGSACNLVAVRPGVALAYQRNTATLAEFERQGFRVMDAATFLGREGVPADGERTIITFEAAELVRGGGGPRCMTMPLQRDDL